MAIPSWLVPNAGFAVSVWDRFFDKDEQKDYIFTVLERAGEDVTYSMSEFYSIEHEEKTKVSGLQWLIDNEFMFKEELSEGRTFTRPGQGYLGQRTANYRVEGSRTKKVMNFYPRKKGVEELPQKMEAARDCFKIVKTYTDSCRACRRDPDSLSCAYCGKMDSVDVVFDILVDKKLGLVLRKDGRENEEEVYFIHDCNELQLVLG